MPAKGRTPRKTSAAKPDNSTSTPVGDDAALIAREQAAAERSRVAAEGVYMVPINEPGRFTAGTGALADEMQSSFEATAIQAQAIRLQRLGADGEPTGDPVRLEGATATVNLEPAAASEFAEMADAMNRMQTQGIDVEFSTSDPATVATVRELTRIPIPTAVINQWWPAFVRVPGDDTTWNLCKVFLAPQGLYVYRAAPTEPETFTTGAMPTWYSSVNFEETAKPVSGYAARNAGIPLVTAAGKVTVQPTMGCGCQARGLKGWRPSWLRNVISWGDGVKLAAGSTDGR